MDMSFFLGVLLAIAVVVILLKTAGVGPQRETGAERHLLTHETDDKSVSKTRREKKPKEHRKRTT